MSESFLGHLLIIVVIVLLLALLIVTILAIQVLLSLRRTVRLLERAAGDVKNFSKAISRVKLPLFMGGLLKRLIRLKTSDSDKRGDG